VCYDAASVHPELYYADVAKGNLCHRGGYYRPFPQRLHGQLARPAEAGTFTRAGTGGRATAVAAVLLRHAQLSQVALC